MFIEIYIQRKPVKKEQERSKNKNLKVTRRRRRRLCTANLINLFGRTDGGRTIEQADRHMDRWKIRLHNVSDRR